MNDLPPGDRFGHYERHDDLDIEFPGFPADQQAVIVQPKVYVVGGADVPPPEVQEIIDEAKARGVEVTAVRIDLSHYVPCSICKQECLGPMNQPPEGFIFVCWDCIEEKKPGFIESMKEKQGE